MRQFSANDLNTNEINEIIWKCGQCYSCRARCPRNCKVGLGVLALLSKSVREGNAPKKILHLCEEIKNNLYSKGETFLPSTAEFDLIKEFGVKTYNRCSNNGSKRKRLGFKDNDARKVPIPEDSIEEIRNILILTGFMEDMK
jgi:heterodisulfide reductase subunit C1